MKPLITTAKGVFALLTFLMIGVSAIQAQKPATNNKNTSKPTTQKPITSSATNDDDLIAPFEEYVDKQAVEKARQVINDWRWQQKLDKAKTAEYHQLYREVYEPFSNDMAQRRAQYEKGQTYVVKRKKVASDEIDFIGIFEKIPLPASSFGAAKSQYCNNEGPYYSFEMNVTTIGKRFGEEMMAHSEAIKLTNKGQAAVEQEAIKQAQANPMLQGIDVAALAKMSEAERAKYSEQIKKQLMANANQMQQGADPEAMAIMNNKNLSQSQKEAAVKALMAKRVEENKKKPITPKTEAEMIAENAGFEKTMKEVNEGKYQMEANLLIGATMKGLGEAATEYIKRKNTISMIAGAFAERQTAAYGAEFDKIPVIVIGEGRDKDPDQVAALDEKYKRMSQEFYANTLTLEAQALADYKSRAKYEVGRFHDFMGEFKPNQHKASNPFNDIIMQVLQGVDLVLNQALKISEASAEIAGNACSQAVFYTEDKNCKCFSKK